MGDFERRKPTGKPYGKPSGKSFGKPKRDDSRDNNSRPDWQNRVANKEAAHNKPKAPPIPDEISSKDLPMPIRVQLKTLTEENAEQVARHLVMVGLLIDQDADLALAHAKTAASRAGRIAFIRETLGIAAYRAGDFTLALRELLAHRRATGTNEQIPLIVDSERGLGRPQRALDEGRGVDRTKLDPEVRVNLAIAMSGARLDLGQNEMALAELEIRELDPAKVFEYSVPLFWAYADTLDVLGRTQEAKKWSDLAARAEKALNPEQAPEAEALHVIEEIEIPLRRDEQQELDERG